MIKLRVLRWGSDPGLSEGPNVIIGALKREKEGQGQGQRRKCDSGSRHWGDVFCLKR